MGIHITFIDDDVSPVYGVQKGTKQTLSLSYGERLTELGMPNIRSMLYGFGFTLTTSKGQAFSSWTVPPSTLPLVKPE